MYRGQGLSATRFLLSVTMWGLRTDSRIHKTSHTNSSEYWVINPNECHVTLFSLEAGFYESAVYTGK
jgi:hypothetical protein